MDLLDPEFFEDDDVRAALVARDIGTLYRLLQRLGMTQREIAGLTGQSQPEVYEILKGRKVRDVWVLERIMTVSAYPERGWASATVSRDWTHRLEEVDEYVKRRLLLSAALGEAFLGLGEPIEVPFPAGIRCPRDWAWPTSTRCGRSSTGWAAWAVLRRAGRPVR